MRKPMAVYRKPFLYVFIESTLIMMLAMAVSILLTLGFSYLPEFLEWRDGEKHVNIYGLRG